MMNLVRPTFFLPIHGEYRHLLLHARLAQEVGIPEERIIVAENGQVIQCDEQGIRLKDRVPTGRIMVDGKGIGDVGRSVLRERRALSEHGLVVVSLVLDEETGTVAHGPEVYSRGFVFETETGHLLEDAICVVLEVVEDIGPEVGNRVEKIRTRLQSVLKQYFFFTIGRRPFILPIVIAV